MVHHLDMPIHGVRLLPMRCSVGTDVALCIVAKHDMCMRCVFYDNTGNYVGCVPCVVLYESHEFVLFVA